MTVKELIELLHQEDPEAQVHITYNYGDYWRTIVAPRVNHVEEGSVAFSHYHNMPMVSEGGDESPIEIVVLLGA